MRSLITWNSFYEAILEKNIVDAKDTLPSVEEFKLIYPNDRNFRYVFKNGNWYARRKSDGQIRNLNWGVGNGFPKWQESINKLENQFPGGKDKNASPSTTDTPTDGSPTTSTVTSPPATSTATTPPATSTATTPPATSTTSKDAENKELINKGQRIFANCIREKTLFFRMLDKNVIIYKGEDLQEDDRKALVAYIETMNFRLSRDNFDHRKGEKLVFKRNPDTKPSEKENEIPEETLKKEFKLSKHFDRPNDPVAVNEKILELFRKNIIDFNKRSERNEKGVRKIDILVKSIPLSEADINVFSKYFGECGFEAFPNILDQKQQQVQLGNQNHTYKYISEKSSTEIKENNILSVFLHYYFEGGMKKRLLSKNFKYKGKPLDDATKNKLEQFVQALNYKEKVDFKEEKTNDSYIFGYQEFIHKNRQ